MCSVGRMGGEIIGIEEQHKYHITSIVQLKEWKSETETEISNGQSELPGQGGTEKVSEYAGHVELCCHSVY